MSSGPLSSMLVPFRKPSWERGCAIHELIYVGVQRSLRIALLQSSYEEIRLNEKDVGDKMKWLKEGMDCILLSWNGRV